MSLRTRKFLGRSIHLVVDFENATVTGGPTAIFSSPSKNGLAPVHTATINV